METPTIANIRNYNPMKLAEYLTANYIVQIPIAVETPEEIAQIGSLLSILGNSYSFLMSLLAVAQADIRVCRRTKNKADIEDAIDRRDVLETFVSVVKMQHQTVSRMLTAKQESRNEYRMLNDSYS